MVSKPVSELRPGTGSGAALEPEPEDLYQVVSFRFGVRADSEQMRRHVARVLRHFALDDSEARAESGRAAYHLVDTGPGKEHRYQVHFNGSWVRGTGGFGDCLNQFFWHVNDEAYACGDGFLLIHAGAVVGADGRAVLFPGDSGSGKTTLVTGLVRAGFGYLTDETAVVNPESLLVHPFPKALTLKGSGRELWPELVPAGDDLGTGYWHVDPIEVRPGCLAEPAPVSHVVFPRYAAGAPAGVTRLSPAAGCALLGSHCFNLYRWRSRALPVLAGIGSSAPAYRLVAGSLDAALEAVAGLIRD